MVLKVSLLTAHVRLSDCRRDCAVDRRFEFDKRSQLFIRTHDETVIAVAMCISNEDCWPSLQDDLVEHATILIAACVRSHPRLNLPTLNESLFRSQGC
jgi:hypothetical protein